MTNTPDTKAVLEKLRGFNIFMTFHTHWDREWYSTVNVYQHRSVEFMERVFEVHGSGSPYPAFYLDGQTCLLDDYLGICPKKRDLVKKVISEGRIQVGPWYVQPEEQQPSAESHIRNLEIGLRIANEFGDRAEKIGYLCDPITYIPQMPQIFRNFGILSMLHSRGITRNHEKSPQEMTAVSPDGSEVFLLHLTNCSLYYIDFGTTYESFLAKLVFVADHGIMAGSTSKNILLTSGGDQLYPTGKELDFIARLEKEEGIKITPTTLPEYIRMLRQTAKPAAKVTTEGIWEHLQDIYSGRIPLKRRIKTCERKLERAAEPLVALAALCGADPQIEIMDELWRRNIENMFHDSIYCAHADEVTRDIEHRCEKLEELVDRMTRIAFYEIVRLTPNLISSSVKNSHAIFNPTGLENGGFHEVEIYCDTPGPHILTDAAGVAIPAVLLAEHTQISMLTERYTVESQVHKQPIKTWQKYLLMLPPIPPASPLVFSARPKEIPSVVSSKPGSGPLTIRNNQLFLSCGSVEKNIRFYLEGDAGDLYTFHHNGESEELYCENPRWNQIDGFSVLTFNLRPATRKLQIEVTVWMHSQTREIRFRYTFQNNDHGFRVVLKMDQVFPAGRHTAHSPYTAVDRRYEPVEDLEWARPGFEVRFPFVEFFGINDKAVGLNFFSPDITNYRVDQENNVTLVLFRSVTDMTIPAFLAGPPLPTPDARILGKSEFDLTLIPERMTPEEQMKFAWTHNTPLPYFPLNIQEHSEVVRPERPAAPRTKTMSFPFIQPSGPDVLIGAFRCITVNDSLKCVARVVNLSREPKTCTFATGFDFTEAVQTDLQHQPLKILAKDHRNASLTLTGSQISTIVFKVS
jgi:mannosylglycerate hydrolase